MTTNNPQLPQEEAKKEPDEIWKDVLDYEGLYQVSNMGNVKSKRGLLSPHKTISGRLRVVIQRLPSKQQKGFYVHRLVAQAFLPAIPGKDEVNHINGDPLDNTVENLEWCNRSENMIHAWETGLCKASPKAHANWLSVLESNKKVVYAKSVNTGEVTKYNSVVECREALNSSTPNISNSCKTGRPRKGYYFSYTGNFDFVESVKPYKRKVVCTSPDGTVTVYDSIRAVANALNGHPSYLAKVLKGVYTHFRENNLRYEDR